jgi:hypothetical protein
VRNVVESDKEEAVLLTHHLLLGEGAAMLAGVDVDEVRQGGEVLRTSRQYRAPKSHRHSGYRRLSFPWIEVYFC